MPSDTQEAQVPVPVPVAPATPEPSGDAELFAAVADLEAQNRSAAEKASVDAIKKPKAAKAAEAEVAPALAETAPPAEPESTGWAAIKKAEKAQRLAKQALDQERQTFKTQQEQLTKMTQEQQASLAKLQEDPIGFLNAHGVNFQNLVEAVAAGKPLTQPKAVQAVDPVVLKLQQKLEALENAQAQQHTNVYQNNLASELAKPEFELLQSYPEAQEAMFEYAVAHLNQTGVVLTPAEVASTLQEEWAAQLDRMRAHPAIQKKLGLATPPSASPAPVSAPSKSTSLDSRAPTKGAKPKQARATPVELARELSVWEELQNAADLVTEGDE